MDKYTGITYYSETHKNADYEYHFHLYYEIMYITSGEVVIYSNGSEVTMHPGTVCVIPPFTPHKTKYRDADIKNIIFGSLYVENYISPEALKQLEEGISTNVSISKKDALSETVETLIEEIDFYNGESAYIYLYKILMSCKVIYLISHREDKTITKAIHYIGIHSKSKLTLDEIASACKVTKFHVCRAFKKELNITPVEYITFAKMRRAVTMLCYTDRTIAKISSLLSFYSPKYFTKLFRICFGVSPSEFKKNDSFEIKKQYYLNNRMT